MKKTILLFTTLISLNFVYSQEWKVVHSDPEGSDLRCIKFIDANIGFVVGKTGRVLKTTDSGTTWITQSSGTSNDLNSIFLVDINIAYAVGSAGTIIKTSDGGATWISLPSGISTELKSVYFSDSNTGYVVGLKGKMLKTINAGLSWSELQIVSSNYDFISLVFTDSKTGIAIADSSYITTYMQICRDGQYNCPRNYDRKISLVLLTTDGGLTWHRQHTVDGSLSSVSFVDNNVGYVIGKNWKIGSFVCFCNSLLFYYEDTYGIVLKTIDGGFTWKYSDRMGDGSGFNSVYFIDENNGYIVGKDNFTSVQNPGQSTQTVTKHNETFILHTIDAGISWTDKKFNMNSLKSIFFTDPLTGYAVDEFGTIFKTTKDGEVLIFTVSTDTLRIAALDKSTRTFDITSNTFWTVTSNQSWLTVNINSGFGNATITLSAKANPNAEPRTGMVTVEGSNLVVKTITITQDGGTTGITILKGNEFNIYPNPASSILYINSRDNNSLITIYDFTGKMILNEKINDNQVNIRNLLNGAYIIKLENSKGIIWGKFVKQ